MLKYCFFILVPLCLTGNVYSQYLEKISPVFLAQGTMPDSISFILTATDYNTFQGKKVDYPSSLQIIDADRPWPPRWFATAPFAISHMGRDTVIAPIAKPLINAFWQDDKMTVLSMVSMKDKNNKVIVREAEVTCNRQLDWIDTFVRYTKIVDTHDYRTKPNGEKIYFVAHDTLLDLRTFLNNTTDSAVALGYQSIEIVDAHRHVIFSWNPLYHLRLDEMYLPYLHVTGTMNTSTSLDWCHGSSLCWDEDGNILYSYKHIGIGKIARSDGHIIWKVDRNRQRPNEQSDTIPIFLQHDFKSFKDPLGNTVYSVVSNGDSSRPYTTALQFTVHGMDGKQPVFKVVRKVVPETPVPNTGAGGNYDVYPDSSYLINYGAFEGDSGMNRLLFECRDKNDKVMTRYKVPQRIICYRVHKMNWQPPRPLVHVQGGVLSVANEQKEHTWYRLSGPGNTVVNKVGAGNKYQPAEKGIYCVTEKYGIGYTVSVPVSFP